MSPNLQMDIMNQLENDRIAKEKEPSDRDLEVNNWNVTQMFSILLLATAFKLDLCHRPLCNNQVHISYHPKLVQFFKLSALEVLPIVVEFFENGCKCLSYSMNG